MEPKKIEAAWRCDECHTWYDWEDEAHKCCAPSITEGYKCKACGAYHPDAADAEGCCVVSYSCPECEEVFKTIEQARDCCGCEIILDYIPPAQLEQYGQQRLALP